jgi:hypothetical protein
MHVCAFRRAFAVVALPPLAAMLVACTALPRASNAPGPVQGEGDVASEDRTAGAFQHISASGGIHLEITEGAPTSVMLTAQPNILPLVTTEVADGQLIVNVAAPGFTSSQPVTLVVVADAVD